jgi:LIVCS family branched-chain amino acid:cation transporter
LIGVILYHGSRHAYFGALGERTTFFLTLIILALLGPFGVVPRCITVAYGGFELLFPSFPNWLFSLLFCGLMAMLIWVRHRIVSLIGRVITPWLMLGVFGVILLGLLQGRPIEPSGVAALTAFTIGLIKGYHTMDLLAGFFFATTTVYYLKAYASEHENPRKLIQMSIGASMIGAGLLAAVYIGFVALGARYAPELVSVPPNDYLAVIAGHALGSFAIPVVALTIALACLTTGAILSALFADFIFQDVADRKVKREGAIVGTLVISFGVSLLGFTMISEWLGVILEVMYPALIALAIANIIQLRAQTNWGRPCFWGTLSLSLLIKLLG